MKKHVLEEGDRELSTVYGIWELGRNVAVKVVKESRTAGSSFPKQIKTSHYRWSKYRRTCENGNTYIFMEYIEGETLTEVIEKRGGISQEQAVSWGLEILIPYNICMSSDLRLWGLKTDNLMIQNDGRIRLIDFGAVKE